DLAVGAAAPMAARQERPADLDLAQFGLVAVIAARADDASACLVDERKAHFGVDRATEEFAERRLGIAIRAGMHFPDFRIRAGREHAAPVVLGNGSDSDAGSDQGR